MHSKKNVFAKEKKYSRQTRVAVFVSMEHEKAHHFLLGFRFPQPKYFFTFEQLLSGFSCLVHKRA